MEKDDGQNIDKEETLLLGPFVLFDTALALPEYTYSYSIMHTRTHTFTHMHTHANTHHVHGSPISEKKLFCMLMENKYCFKPKTYSTPAPSYTPTCSRLMFIQHLVIHFVKCYHCIKNVQPTMQTIWGSWKSGGRQIVPRGEGPKY